MSVNIEVKARLDSIARMRDKLRELTGTCEEILEQEDIFFRFDKGLLKYRTIKGIDGGELIYYNRDYSVFPFISRYVRQKISFAGLESLKRKYGVRCTVRKKRTLFVLEDTRIHLDEVENLGTFFEIEVVLPDDSEISHGKAVAASLMNNLGIPDSALIHQSYEAMLAEKRTGS